ncbi:MAG TPA: adenylate/guanylate cyclase domain-containing protein [Burkholderiaceae bacterium]|nr:adenylate/guanylate cyclase domain-containing protein [Burkholderiaceae bacterium]
MPPTPRSATPCPACGFACDAAFLFCPRCGAAQKPPAAAETEPEADRRQVTLLFADLTGFTSLAERLDPETVRMFQNALFAAMARAVTRFDGFTEKFVGDAVMAVFGAPRAHEDDPERALQAALEMLHHIDELNEQWVSRLGRAVTLHIGVHSGPVVAGSLGSAAGGSYAVTGDTVNTASRLLSAAEPGTVLVSDATRALAQHRFVFEPAGELALRGKAQPLTVHRLIAARDDAQADIGLSAPLVGRGAALEQLQHAVERMHGGCAQVVRVIGEAGAGKSRLLAEFFARLEADGSLAGIAVRRTTCSSLGEPTYGIFGALFREAYRVDEHDTLAVARGKLQRGLRTLGADADEADAVTQVLHYLLGIREDQPRDIEPEQLQRQITLAARALLERRTAQQPLVLVIDDLQWGDAASIDLLGELVDQLAEQPLLLLFAQRPDARAWHAPSAAPTTTITLGPLADADARALADQLLGASSDPELRAVRDLVVARAGGNPLFVEEIVRSLAARGLLVRRDHRWECAAPRCDAVDVPATLYGLLLSRVDALTGDDRRVLQAAAVLGVEFDTGLLQAIANEAGDAVDAALQRLAAADLLREDAQARWRFTHALLHEVVYQNLLLTRRTELHQRAGRALEAARDAAAHGPQRLVELTALGHHWSLSPDKVRGARYQLEAGDWARAVYANDDAIRHYELALGTLAQATVSAAGHTGDALQAELDARERIADLLALKGQRHEALAQYDAVMAALAQHHDPVRAARVLRKTGGLHWDAGERERAAACFDAGLERLGDDGDAIERAHLLQEMGRLAFRAGDNHAALGLAQRALAEVPDGAAGAAAVRAQAYNTLGVALARLDRTVEAVEQIERSVQQAEQHELLQAACRGYTNLGVLYASLNPQRSIETCLRGLETARKVGDLGFQSRLYANLAVAYCALTNRCEAEGIAAAHAAATLDRRLGLLDHLAVPLIVLGQIHQCHGDHEQAFASYREALQLAEQINEPQLLFPCYDGLATLYLDAGDAVNAEAYLDKARALCERAGLEPDALMVLPFLC